MLLPNGMPAFDALVHLQPISAQLDPSSSGIAPPDAFGPETLSAAHSCHGPRTHRPSLVLDHVLDDFLTYHFSIESLPIFSCRYNSFSVEPRLWGAGCAVQCRHDKRGMLSRLCASGPSDSAVTMLSANRCANCSIERAGASPSLLSVVCNTGN